MRLKSPNKTRHWPKSIAKMFLLSFGFLFFSCDYEQYYDFHVYNQLDSTIVVRYTVDDHMDSVFIEPCEGRLVFSDTLISGPLVSNRNADLIGSVKVSNNAFELTIEESAWNYRELDDDHAVYWIKVDSIRLEKSQ